MTEAAPVCRAASSFPHCSLWMERCFSILHTGPFSCSGEGFLFFFFFTEKSALTKQQQLRVEEAVGLLVRPAPTEPTEDAAAERTSSLLTHRGLRDTSLQIQWSFCTMQPFTHRHKNKWIIYTLRWGAGRTIRTTVRFRVQPSSTCRNQRSIQQHCFE